MIPGSLDKFTNVDERSSWRKGYEFAFEQEHSETQFEQQLKKLAPSNIGLIGLNPNTLKRVRDIYNGSNWTKQQKYAFMSGLLNGLNEIANMDDSTAQ